MLRSSLISFMGMILAGSAAHADCSNTSIHGDYSFTVHGQSLSADGSTSTGLIDGVGTISFDGNGGLTQQDFIVKNGTEVPGGPPNPSGFHTEETGTYTINPDCTGAAEITLSAGNTRSLALVIAKGGTTIHAIVSATTVGGSPAVLQVFSDFEKIYGR